MLLVSLLASAHADAAMAPCMNTYVGETIPAPLAEDVPVDILPTVMLVDGGCGGSAWTVTLGLDGAEVASVEHGANDGLYIEVDPGADLLPNTFYTLDAVPADGGETTSIGFTTGSGTSAALDGVPVLQDVTASVTTDGLASVQATIVPASSADGESFVALSLADSPDDHVFTAHAYGTGDVFSWANFSVDAVPDEVCVIASERDLAGNWTDSEPTCVAPDVVRSSGSGGCLDVTRGSPIGWLSMGLALTTILRRARRA